MALSENMVLMKTKMSSLAEVKNLNLWGAELVDISLCTQLPNLEVLALSVNHVTTLHEVATCRKLRELYLRKNDVADIRQLTYLSQLPRLTTLWLNDNPVARMDNYRLYCIKYAPSLTLLDTVEVTGEERAAASRLPELANLAGGGAAAGPAPAAEEASAPRQRVSSAAAEAPREPVPAQHGSRADRPSSAAYEGGGSNNDSSQRAILTAIVTLLGELNPNSMNMLRQEIDARLSAGNGRR